MSQQCQKPKTLILGILSLSLLPLVVQAQDKEQFAQAQKKNSEALKQYTWQSRTEIKVKGESKNVKLEQIRYDIDGKLQKTQIGGSQDQQQAEQSKGGRRGRRGRGKAKEKIVESKKKEFAEMMQALGKLVASYRHIPTEKMQAFAQNAMKSPGEEDLAGTVRIQGGDVLHTGDAMTIWIDPDTQMMRRVEILTALEEKPVTVVSEYQSLPDGPTYQARSVVEYPEKEVELTVENYDYQRVGS